MHESLPPPYDLLLVWSTLLLIIAGLLWFWFGIQRGGEITTPDIFKEDD